MEYRRRGILEVVHAEGHSEDIGTEILQGVALVGLMDHLCKLFSATNYAVIAFTVRKTVRANGYGYKKHTSVDIMFGTLFEALAYAQRWSDTSLAIAAQDVLTAFDTVEHAFVLEVYSKAGASAHQVLALARDMAGVKVKLRIPGVAESDEIPMTKALKTGGKAEPNIFVYMFETVLDYLEGEWEQLGIGFHLKSSGKRIASLNFVDNLFLLADNLEQCKFMVTAVTTVIQERYGWTWKPQSLELVVEKLFPGDGYWEVPACGRILQYQVRSSMVALGGLLDTDKPAQALRRYSFSAGDKAFYKYLRHFKGKAPVSLKLRAFAAAPRGTALFLCPVMHWSGPCLYEAIRWERRLLRIAFRMKPKPGEGRMLYFTRTAARLQQWMSYCKYKQIHVAILGRVFMQVWHERTVASQLAAIRCDRDLDIWEGVKDLPGSKRKREDGILHARSGPQGPQFSTLFATVWDIHWRQRLDQCADLGEWRSMKRGFVCDVCKVLNLPEPFEGYFTHVENMTVERVPTAASQRVMPSLRRLKRDGLWLAMAARPQLEFVVDNETVSDLMNLEARVANEFYAPMVARMRENTFTDFAQHFEYKAGFLPSHEWRPREFNKQADAVCNWVLDDRVDIDCLDVNGIASRLLAGHMLQLFSDGGYDGRSGSSAIVAICYEFDDGCWQANICGHRGWFMLEALSSFQTEI